MLGDDLGELLGARIPADHSRQTLADAYARPAPAACSTWAAAPATRSTSFARSTRAWNGSGPMSSSSPEVAGRARSDAQFVTFDGESLPFEDASFDFVYCKQVLEHVRRPEPLLREVARVLRPGGWFAGSTSQLEAFHSLSVANPTPYGFVVLAEEAGLEVVELRPGIDGLTLVSWRALGMPRFFGRWWARESPLNRVIEAAGRLGSARCPHPQPGEAHALRPVRVPGPAARSRSSEGDRFRRANRRVMSDLTAKRTLVKSPPELWGELSEVDRLAKHLEAFGEIKITKLEPEHTVAWEGEHASGTVSIEPSGWGTKVTLTAELPQPEEPEEPAEPEPPAEAS